MKDIAIFGGGGLGRETALLIQQINAQSACWNLLGFYDDGLPKGSRVDRYPVLGNSKDLAQGIEGVHLTVAVADPEIRKVIVGKLSPKQVFATLIHPSCLAGDPKNEIGKGCILTAGVILTTGIRLGDFVIINLLSTLGHDVVVGNYSTVMPGCSISGNVKVGDCTLVGTGARILQNLSVGKNCKIGAGAVVTQSFYDNKTILGIPAYEK